MTRHINEPCPETSQCRGGGIRTHGLFVPNEARYQAAPHPVVELCTLCSGLDVPHAARVADNTTACQYR